MAAARRTYRMGLGNRLANWWMTRLARRGRGAPYLHLLTVTGRSSGQPHTTPVDVMTLDGSMWLVAPYGEVNWVRNARAAGLVELSRGGETTQYRAEEVDAATAAPVIGTYIQQVPITKNWWSVGADATEQQLRTEADTHPVFRLTTVQSQP